MSTKIVYEVKSLNFYMEGKEVFDVNETQFVHTEDGHDITGHHTYIGTKRNDGSYDKLDFEVEYGGNVNEYRFWWE